MKEFQLSEVKLHNKITSCWIIINDRVYDITEYIDEHPGGQHILLQYAGKDATEAFEQVGHSSKAYHELNKYVIGRVVGTKVELIQSVKQTRALKNLITHEDKIGMIPHVHKALGLFCLFHYLYRFGYCILRLLKGKPNAWDSGFDESYKSLILILIHALLSYSSLIFHIPKKQTGKPMIWQEFRAHNILFATRSIICFIIVWLAMRNKKIEQYQMAIQSLIVLLTFKFADIITESLREANTESTTRTLPYWDNCDYFVEKTFKYFYTLAQFQASLVCFFSGKKYLNTIFYIMFPIQLASFLMTLVRKGIISTKQYHYTYLLSLILPSLVNCREIGLYYNIIISLLILLLRTKMRLNKYSIWLTWIVYLLTKSVKVTLVSFIITLLVFKRSKSRNKVFLNHKNQKRNVRLIRKKKLTHNTYELTFKIPEDNNFGLRIGEHITIYSDNPNKSSKLWNGLDDLETESIIKRKYTPIKIHKGYFKLAIKEYKPSDTYPDGGKMSQMLAKLKVNDSIVISGPNGHNTYLGHGRMMVYNKIIEANHIYMICAGTGLTPMYNILWNILESPQDKTVITMLYVNKTQQDIMLNRKLLKLQKKYPKQYHLYNCLTKDSNSKADYHGRPDKEILEKIISKSKSIIMLCGPKSFVNSIYSNLKEFDIDTNYIVVF